MRTGHVPVVQATLTILLSLAEESAPCRLVLPSRVFLHCFAAGAPW